MNSISNGKFRSFVHFSQFLGVARAEQGSDKTFEKINVWGSTITLKPVYAKYV